MITHRASESVYSTSYSKIFESAHDVRIESNRNGRFESNLEASQVPSSGGNWSQMM